MVKSLCVAILDLLHSFQAWSWDEWGLLVSENKIRKDWHTLHFSPFHFKNAGHLHCTPLLLEVGFLSCFEANPSSSFCYSVLSQLLIPLRTYSISHFPSLHFQSFLFSWHLPRNLKMCSGPPDPLSDCSISLHHSSCHCCHFLTTHSFLYPCAIWLPPPTSLWKLLFWFIEQHPHHQIKFVNGPYEAPTKVKPPCQD